MAKKRDEMVDGVIADEAEGWLANLLAEEEPYDRKMLWQLGSWAAAALGALAFAFMATQTISVTRSDLAAANELVRQNQQIAQAATERETEARRLVAAIDTLNADRDRLYARVTGLEQNLDSVTSSIKQTRTLIAPAPLPTAPPVGAPPESVTPSPSPAASGDDKAASRPSVSPLQTVPPAALDLDPGKDAKDKESKAAARSASGAKIDKDAQAPKAPPAAAKQPVAEAAKPDAAKTEADTAKADAAKSDVAKSGSAKAEIASKTDPKTEPKTESKAELKTEITKPADAVKPLEAIRPAESKPAEPQAAAAATPDTAAMPTPSPIVTAAIPPAIANDADAAAEVPVAKTEFGVDLGTASSIEGLRALWRGVQSSNRKLMAPLRPIIAIKERSGLGMQLRLIAGPLTDAAAAARICAVLSENDRPCETAFFDGQRLTPASEFPAAKSAPPPRKKPSRASRRVGPPVAVRPPARSGFSFLGGN